MADEPVIGMIGNIRRESTAVELKPWRSGISTITKPMISSMGPSDIPESALAIGFAIVTEPDTISPPTHEHPFDQWIYLFGAEDFSEFDADVEMTVGDEVLQINYPCYVFVPKNVKHCPLVVKRVGKPIIFADARLTPEASGRQG